METERYSAENAFLSEKKNGDIKKTQKLRDLMRTDDSSNVQEHQSGDDDVKLLEKGTKSYAKKSVKEPELPDLIVCLNEASYSVVKDICINDEVPPVDKNLVENDKFSHNEPFPHKDLDLHSDLIKEGVENLVPISDVVEKDCKMDINRESPSINMMENGEGYIHETMNVSSTQKVVPEETLPVRVEKTENSEPEASNSDDDNGRQETYQETRRDAELSVSEVPSTTEESNNISSNKVSINDKTENENVSTTTYSGLPPPSKSEICEEGPQNSDPQEDGLPESQTASSRSLSTQQGHRESSVSAVDTIPSALITYSGPIPYSGNISIRSDSSTTSTRSFAFPILNSEWNSSPVRMAKADRRHYRKHQRWKLSLLCCKF